MKKRTKELLEESGYEIENAQIESVRLTMADHGALTSDLVLNGHGWGVCYGGYVLGKGYLGSKDFEGYGSGMEAIMRIMDTVGVEECLENIQEEMADVFVCLTMFGKSAERDGILIYNRYMEKVIKIENEKEARWLSRLEVKENKNG